MRVTIDMAGDADAPVGQSAMRIGPGLRRPDRFGEAAIEALAVSIQHKGLIQNLVVESETKEDGTPTGNYFVTAGEGRRLAMPLRAKRKQIRKSEL